MFEASLFVLSQKVLWGAVPQNIVISLEMVNSTAWQQQAAAARRVCTAGRHFQHASGCIIGP
jgi:hypothetical protein